MLSNQILNTIIPGYIDKSYKEALEKRYHGDDKDGRYIEVKDEYIYLMESTLFRFGPDKFMGMLEKRHSQ